MAKPDRIFASELLEREVMDLRAGEIVGAVTDFNVTREGVVTQLGVLPLQWYRGGRGIAPGAITNVTRERVSIEDSTLLDEFGPDGDTSLSAMLGDNVYGKQVLQADGELLGSLADFAFDLTDGRITDIVVFGDDDKRSKIAVDQIQTIGKSYIVVSRGSGSAEVQPGPKLAAAGTAEKVRQEAPVAAANALEVEEPVASTGWPKEAAVAQVVEEIETAPAPVKSEDSAETTPAAEVSPPPLPEVDEESGGAALAPEPEMAEPVPPIVEESAPPAPQPKAPRRAPAVRTKAPAAEDEQVQETATGRRSRPSGATGTGRASRPSETATGRSSRPRTAPRRQEEQLTLGDETEASAAAPAADSLDSLGLSTFDRRKAEFLLGKASHRDIRGGDGKLLLTQGTPFNVSRIGALREQGLLNSVFLEMTQHKG